MAALGSFFSVRKNFSDDPAQVEKIQKLFKLMSKCSQYITKPEYLKTMNGVQKQVKKLPKDLVNKFGDIKIQRS